MLGICDLRLYVQLVIQETKLQIRVNIICATKTALTNVLFEQMFCVSLVAISVQKTDVIINEVTQK